ncbi:MAG TPA: helix-turn-helix transcriptional regulator [Candidatus Tectomicrobia bacterium]
MQELGERVHVLRRRQRLSQKALADVVGASPTTISNLEQGKLGTIHIDHLVALAHHLNVSTDYLLGLSASDEGTVPMVKATPTALQPTKKRQRPRTVTPVD